ncbi:natural resistance-associated macrophage protein [Annulohypoxylon maeteangense]|uniref:natural resistance-associated macrophage protein n=1 Tax=Annulohypoxylon maeteangense TaxID=1927788 RepID=UPI0020087D6C|nr:natural resistance-associated macrophage protein [Annulohypoxylon maeteangense]KAI0887965.1 natural resistance-associated macrophage protein [Annulohypoxylon maeteangense]
MNRTSRTGEPYGSDGLNQSPDYLPNDLITNQDLNDISDSREKRSPSTRSIDNSGDSAAEDGDPDGKNLGASRVTITTKEAPQVSSDDSSSIRSPKRSPWGRITHTIITFGKFVGPGFLVAVAYIDPGNYSTDISAGAENQFRLLFIILMSNLFAIFLQCLSIKLGTVTGMNLAEACRAFLPRWINYFLYFLAEAAIIATDIAEVIGTAIGLNLLIPKLPLVAGCAISILDVMIILIFYKPNGSVGGLRIFEWGVMLLVFAVVICFCIQLSLIQGSTAGEVLIGYVPNDSITKSGGLFQACGILGATVMPHSLYLGSGIVQTRLMDYDNKRGLLPPRPASSSNNSNDSGITEAKTYYIPSLKAIKHSLKYSYAEVAISLFTFALFVNSAILIVAGASLFNNPDALEADIFGIHDLLSQSISPAAGTIFALALLFSGVSAGIVCTISGQMICEGALHWRMKPWLRRLVTRSISITPSIIIAGATGREKLNDALNGSQVALSVVLPFVTAPLIWFTCFNKYMTVQTGNARYKTEGKDSFTINGVSLSKDTSGRELATPEGKLVQMANPWYVSVLAGIIWVILVVMNVANLVLLGLGN